MFLRTVQPAYTPAYVFGKILHPTCKLRANGARSGIVVRANKWFTIKAIAGLCMNKWFNIEAIALISNHLFMQKQGGTGKRRKLPGVSVNP